MKKLLLLLTACLLNQFLIDAQTEIWGVTSGRGDRANFGIIFKTDANGDNFAIQKKFTIPEEGKEPQQLMQAADGMLYGVTRTGGLNGKGVLYQYNPNDNTFTKKFDFRDSLGTYPIGTLTEGDDGMLYGVTSAGGTDGGVIYMFNPITSMYTKKCEIFIKGSRMSNPSGSLIKAPNGIFYGATDFGRDPFGDQEGLIYSYNSATSILTIENDFDGSYTPFDMLKSADHTIYAVTKHVLTGASYIGHYNPTANSFYKIYQFPWFVRTTSSLVQVSENLLYGMSSDNVKTPNLFEFNLKDSIYTIKVSSDFVEKGNDVTNSVNLLYAADKNLYGLLFNNPAGKHKAILFQYNLKTGKYIEKHNLNLTDSTDYGSIGSLTEVKTATTGITQNKNNKNKIFVYPNPTHGLVTVTLDKEIKNDATVKLINILGKTILPSTEITNSVLTIDMLNQPTGIYFIEVNQNQKVYRVKVVKH